MFIFSHLSHYFAFIILLIKLHTVPFGTILQKLHGQLTKFWSRAYDYTLQRSSAFLYLFFFFCLFYCSGTYSLSFFHLQPLLCSTVLFIHSFYTISCCPKQSQLFTIQAIFSVNSFSTNSHFAGFHSFHLPQTGNDHNP